MGTLWPRRDDKVEAETNKSEKTYESPHQESNSDAVREPNLSSGFPGSPGSCCADRGWLPGFVDLSGGRRAAFKRNSEWCEGLSVCRAGFCQWFPGIRLGIRLFDDGQLCAIAETFFQ